MEQLQCAWQVAPTFFEYLLDVLEATVCDHLPRFEENHYKSGGMTYERAWWAIVQGELQIVGIELIRDTHTRCFINRDVAEEAEANYQGELYE
jgi:hypothetical protein